MRTVRNLDPSPTECRSRRRHTSALSARFLDKWDYRTKHPMHKAGMRRNHYIDPSCHTCRRHPARIRCPDRHPSKRAHTFHRRPRPFCPRNTPGIRWCRPYCNKRHRRRNRIGNPSHSCISLRFRTDPYRRHPYTKNHSRNRRSTCTSYCMHYWHSCTASSSSERRCSCTFRHRHMFWVEPKYQCKSPRSSFRSRKVCRRQHHCNSRSSRTRLHPDRYTRCQGLYPRRSFRKRHWCPPLFSPPNMPGMCSCRRHRNKRCRRRNRSCIAPQSNKTFHWLRARHPREYAHVLGRCRTVAVDRIGNR